LWAWGFLRPEGFLWARSFLARSLDVWWPGLHSVDWPVCTAVNRPVLIRLAPEALLRGRPTGHGLWHCLDGCSVYHGAWLPAQLHDLFRGEGATLILLDHHLLARLE
jgi:hypothetical protein